MTVEPYLFFEGRCAEAIEFYQKALGAEVKMALRYKEAPDPSICTPENENKIMHAALAIGGSLVLMSDGLAKTSPVFEGFALSVSAVDEAEAKSFFDALSADGQVTMPLSKTFFSLCFGMVRDKFGVRWMVIVPA